MQFGGSKTSSRMFYNNRGEIRCCCMLPGDGATTSFGMSTNRIAAACFRCEPSFDDTVHSEEAVYISDYDRKTA